MQAYDVVIIGAGAAGLMCARTAGLRGKRVLVLDHANKPGKKILMSGGGRCNFTNLSVEPENFQCPNPHFVKSALGQFSQWDFLALVEKHGIAWHEKQDARGQPSGQLFCNNKASDILDMLLGECADAGVEIRLLQQVVQARQIDSGFHLETRPVTKKNQRQTVQDNTAQSTTSLKAAALVIATGGLSIPTLGASDFAWQLAEIFGLQTAPPSPALVPLVFTDQWRECFAGLAGVSLLVEAGVQEHRVVDALLFTHRGLSGPAILRLSSWWQSGQTMTVNLLPDTDVQEALLASKQASPAHTFRQGLQPFFPGAVVETLLPKLLPPDVLLQTPLQELSRKQLQRVAENLSAWRLKPSGSEGWRTAEVTRGGIQVDQLSSRTLEVKSVPGLYVIGEAVDVVGDLGGFNFQWAWSSGHAAGSHC